MSLLLWVSSLIVLCCGSRIVLAAAHRSAAMKTIFLPGYLTALVMRACAAILSRTQIKSISPPWKEGEPIELGASRIPVFGPVGLAVAPLSICLGLVVYLHGLLDPSLQLLGELPALEPNVALASTVALSAREAAVSAQCLSERVAANPAGVVLFLYLALALVLYGAPSSRELVPVACFVGALFVPVAIIDWLGLVPGFLSRGWYIQSAYGPAAYQAIAMLFSLAVAALALAVVVRLWSLLRSGRRSLGGKGRAKGGGSGPSRPAHAH